MYIYLYTAERFRSRMSSIYIDIWQVGIDIACQVDIFKNIRSDHRYSMSGIIIYIYQVGIGLACEVGNYN